MDLSNVSYTPVYKDEPQVQPDLGFPSGTPDLPFYKQKQIERTMTFKVLTCWRMNFGLSMTPHLLCHVMQRPWSEIRDELTAEYADGKFFRLVNCPDINDIAYYVDYPEFCTFDKAGRVSKNPLSLEYSDKKIIAYPPEQGFINSWGGQGLKELKFRARALTGWSGTTRTPDEIVHTLRAVCHVK